MNDELKLSELFFNPNPVVAELPHLITLLDGELLGKITQLTKSRPGLWPLPAPFDEDDSYNEVREQAKFAHWGLPLNQAEVQGLGRLAKDALFGANLLLMSSDIDEEKMTPLAQTRGQRLPNGAWFTPGYQDIPTLIAVVELAGWVLIPVGPGRSRALFATDASRSDLVARLREWCDRQGRDRWEVGRVDGQPTLRHCPAPEPARTNAMHRQIDAFIGEIELWFGREERDLGPRVQQRVEELEKLRANIERARNKT